MSKKWEAVHMRVVMILVGGYQFLFYYLGDRTVIKTKKGFNNASNKFYYLGDRTVIKTR